MKKKNKDYEFDVVIIGGFGHVGLPLGLALANTGLRVCLYDIDEKKQAQIDQGEMPFIEYGAAPILNEVIKKNLWTSTDKTVVAQGRNVVVAIGTPVDEYLNPKMKQFLDTMESFQRYLTKDQTIIIRSTVYPRTCHQLSRLFAGSRGEWPIAYCPERIAQGYAIRELGELPQLVSGLTNEAADRAAELFSRIAPKVIKTSVEEAELAKLFSNAWRYIQFSVANQFHMMSTQFGVDFNRVRDAMRDGYGRNAALPTAGFAAGPCLLKDTMQLAAFNNGFPLGHAAMMVNEGLPNFIVDNLSRRYDLSKTRVGILGMTFKGDIDDTRDSLSYKLGKILRFQGATVLYSDEFVEDPTFVSAERVLNFSEVVIVGAPHSAYRKLQAPEGVEVVDLWNVLGTDFSKEASNEPAEKSL